MSGMEKIKKHRTQILTLACRYGAGNLRAFGSVARSEDRADSDVDFLVSMAPGHDLFDLLALARELEDLLHQKTDVVSDEELNPYLKERILQEAVAV